MSLSIDSLLSNYTRYDKQLYGSVDRNKDGLYSKQEVGKFAQSYEKSTGETIDVDGLFKAYDIDLSGSFSSEEYAKVIEDDAMHMSVLSGVKKEEAEAAPEEGGTVAQDAEKEPVDRLSNLLRDTSWMSSLSDRQQNRVIQANWKAESTGNFLNAMFGSTSLFSSLNRAADSYKSVMNGASSYMNSLYSSLNLLV